MERHYDHNRGKSHFKNHKASLLKRLTINTSYYKQQIWFMNATLNGCQNHLLKILSIELVISLTSCFTVNCVFTKRGNLKIYLVCIYTPKVNARKPCDWVCFSRSLVLLSVYICSLTCLVNTV